MMEIKIRQIDNGFVISWLRPISMGQYEPMERVFEEDDSNANKKTVVLNKMLEFLKDYLDVVYTGKKKMNVEGTISQKP